MNILHKQAHNQPVDVAKWKGLKQDADFECAILNFYIFFLLSLLPIQN